MPKSLDRKQQLQSIILYQNMNFVACERGESERERERDTDTHTHIYMYAYIYIYAHTHTYIYIYIDRHVYFKNFNKVNNIQTQINN